MKSKTILIILLMLFFKMFGYDNSNNFKGIITKGEIPIYSTIYSFENHIEDLYSECKLDSILEYNVFRYSIIGYYNLINENKLKRDDIITIINYNQPSYEKRLYVIDLINKNLKINTYVAHGKNSGDVIPKYFSNKPKSLKSSIGFYITGQPYDGKHKYSLKIDGFESYNCNARNRGIVFHGANYVKHEMAVNYKHIGRSHGCPALPIDENKIIVDEIKGGSCLFIYSNKEDYLNNSKYLKIKDAACLYNDIKLASFE